MVARRHRPSLFRLAFACLGLLVFAAPVSAQTVATGRIIGRVIDHQTGAGIVGASVVVVPGGAVALTGIDGRFSIPDAPAGTASLRAENLGFATKVVTGIEVSAAGAVEVNITLQPQALQLDAITVTAAAERGSVSRALDQQRTASNIVSAITAEQMSRSPDGDAAAAMQRVSGVTVQEGRFVFVRGLGERYTTTALNGARVPSAEPERKVVPLDLFPAGLLQTITTSKTFTPDQTGDFSGGRVDIETKEFPGEPQLTLSLSGSVNTAVAGSAVLAGPSSGAEWLGFSGPARNLPGPVAAAGDLLESPPPDQMNRLVGAFRNAWSTERRQQPPNGSFGLTLGGSDALLGQPVSYLASMTYARSTDVRNEQIRASAIPGADGATHEVDRFEGSTGTSSVLWGGLFQFSSLLGTSSRLVLNTTYNRSADNEARHELGNSENLATNLRIERLRFVERDVFSSQLQGEHELGARQRVEWMATASRVQRVEPDRSEIVYNELEDPATGASRGWAWFAGSNEGAVRTFGDLAETAFELGANYRLELGSASRPTWIKLGGLARTTERDANNRVYSIAAFGLTEEQRRLRPEEIFDGRFFQPGDSWFRLTPLSQGGSYAAQDRILAGYFMTDIGLSARMRVIAGARVESDHIRIRGETTLLEPFSRDATWTDVLPALGLNVQLTDAMNLRVSASQTLARPEYRELADVTYRDVLGGEAIRGNSNLERTLIRNADVRWEWYPAAGEVLSLALFAKRFHNPIERVNVATSGTRLVTFVNAKAANNFGVELEVRKRLGTFASVLEPWSVFTNATLMRSRIEIGTDISSQTHPQRAMVGQAPWVVNAGATFAPGEGRSSATLLYNVVGRRIASAGSLPLPDVYEQPRHVLDLSLRLGLSDVLSARMDARNLLDAPYELTQGSVLRESHTTGRSIGLGLSWNW